MTDCIELKKLLDACRAENCDGPREFQKACEALFDVCSIETIAGLVAENERYRKYGCDTCDGSGRLHRADGEYFGECTSCGAYELEQAKRERDQLKAEIEALRKDDLRAGLMALAAYIGPICTAAVVAAMGKGASHG